MTTTNDGSPEANSAGMTDADVLVPIKDFQIASGWASPASAGARARQCCEQLEEGRILFFDRIPFVFFKEDREFLLSQRQSGSGLHKNIPFLAKVLYGPLPQYPFWTPSLDGLSSGPAGRQAHASSAAG